MSHLHFAAARGIVDEVRSAIEAGDDVNEGLPKNGDAPLHLAARGGWPLTVRLLLEAGADPNARNRNGRAPLNEAVSGRDLEVIELLIDAGAEVDPVDAFQLTPILAAALVGKASIVNLLLARGASPDATHMYRDVTEWLEVGGLRGILPQGEPDGMRWCELLRSLMEVAPTPEEYAAENGRNIMIFSYLPGNCDDPLVDAWGTRLREILMSPTLLAECEDRYLTEPLLSEVQRERARAVAANERRARLERQRREDNG